MRTGGNTPIRDLLPSTLLLAGTSVLAFAPDDLLPMLARSFLPQWSFFMGLLAMLAFVRKRPMLGVTSLVGCVLVLGELRVPGSSRMEGSDAAGITIAHLNVLQSNVDEQGVLAAARSTGADVLAFQEVDANWAQYLEAGMATSHPFRLLVPRADCYGIALFSRVPVTELRAVDLDGFPAILARFSIGGSHLRLWSVHARSPGGLEELRTRNGQLRQLAALLGPDADSTMVIGDLNTVSWDDALWGFCARTSLCLQGDVLAATFPALWGRGLIPIDHVLVGSGFTATKSTFTIPGSDHLGLISTVRPCP